VGRSRAVRRRQWRQSPSCSSSVVRLRSCARLARESDGGEVDFGGIPAGNQNQWPAAAPSSRHPQGLPHLAIAANLSAHAEASYLSAAPPRATRPISPSRPPISHRASPVGTAGSWSLVTRDAVDRGLVDWFWNPLRSGQAGDGETMVVSGAPGDPWEVARRSTCLLNVHTLH
jgi:hypothetical protein